MSLLFASTGDFITSLVMLVFVLVPFVLVCRLLIAITRYFNRK